MSNNNYLSIYAKSFNWAGFFLPKKTYLKCSTLYDFCRTVDNIADEVDDLDIKKKNLSNFRDDFINKNFNNHLIKDMWNLIDEFDISKLEKANCKLVSPPRIFQSPASLECKLFKLVKLPGKNNNMIIGEVVGVHLSDKFIKEGIFDILAFNPVARLGYKDYTTVVEKFSLERPS